MGTPQLELHEKHGSSPSVIPKIPAQNLDALNPEQLKADSAVEHDPSIPLQILAGPGSGKTKVLTARIARLITIHKIFPSSICAVTFTNKAANEMRDRLTKILGKDQTKALKMGTFHSICARFLRMYPVAVNLDANFTVCDADESKKLISALIKPYADYMASSEITLSDASIASMISKAKAKGQSSATFLREIENRDSSNPKSQLHLGTEEKKSIQRIVAEVFIGYEQVLKANNALDFDDLLVYGVKLFSTHRASVAWCKHILVDEFQDTNTMQYELMKAIAHGRSVTIVGDPDQSIYGWRSAEVTNLSRMRRDFRDTAQIFLEQNYRSTAAILRASLAVVAEDKNRIPKSLRTSHSLGATPFIGRFESEKEEASFIAKEIKRCVANMGGILRWGDFVVLLRFNALSRPIESALQREGIPCRILGGHRFFERMEVKDILSYLQLVTNPCFNPAFIRAVKVPARGMGDKSLSELSSKAQELKISQMELVERIHDNKVADIKPPIKKKIVSFVKTVRCLRKLDQEKSLPSHMIRRLLDMIQYEEHLKKTQQDWDNRWENVQELITFACELEIDSSKINNSEMQVEKEPDENSMLRDFLQASVLSSEGDNDNEEQSKEKVTLSTCHAAKGLEWPVVLVPSVDQDTFPFYRTEDVEEERRLLYVACTRAQALLYVLHADKRVVAGKTKVKRLSEFIDAVRKKDEGLFSHDVPRFLDKDRTVLSNVLNRPTPNKGEIDRRLAELEIDGNYTNSTYQIMDGRVSTVSLSGTRANANEAPIDQAMYAAPDTLTAISATFMRDHKKTPFSTYAKPVPTPVSYNTSFTPSGVLMSSMESAVTAYPTNFKSGAFYPPQMAESSRQGSSRVQPSDHHRQSARQVRAHNQILLTAKASTYPSNGHHSPVHRTPSSLKPVQDPKLIAPNSVISFVASSAHNHEDKISGAWQVKSQSRNTYQVKENSQLSARALEKQAVKGSLHVPQLLTHTDCARFRHLTESNSARIDSTLPQSSITDGGVVNELSDSGVVGLVAFSVSSTQPMETALSPNTEAISDLPAVQKPNPQAPLQGIGVKRRLGMGRSMTGYSNKKFKHPI